MKGYTSKNNDVNLLGVKNIIWSSLLAIFTMIITASIIFFLTIAPHDLLSMPKVTELHITDALLLLQSYDLYPKIEIRFTNTSENIDFVLEQSPTPNAWIRGSRVVNLIVSRGKILDTIPDFKGKNLDELKRILLTSLNNELLHIREPILYAFDESLRGSIIGQKPEAGTKLSRNTPLELIISRGPNPEKNNVIENYLNMPFEKVVKDLSKKNIPFRFIFGTQLDSDPKILEQTPNPGSPFIKDQEILFKISEPAPKRLKPDYVFGIFSFDIPVSDSLPIVEVILVSSKTTPKQTILLRTLQQGVNLAIPYIAAKQSQLIVKINDTELIRYLVE